MRAAIFLLLPFLGECRNVAPRKETELKRNPEFDGAVSVCYTYTTTYLTTVTNSGNRESFPLMTIFWEFPRG